MSNSDLIRAVIDAVLPSGAVWEYKERGDLSKLYDAIADNAGEVQDFLSTLAYVRDPQLTSVLDDLERDYDVRKDSSLTEQQRRDYLSSVFPRRTTGTAEYMEDQLHSAGFTDVFVYRNDPPINPLGFGWTICGNEYAVCGYEFAQCGGAVFRGILLVNGNGEDDQFVPCDDECSGYWAGVFFVGGVATFDLSGHILSIETVDISASQRTSFERIILQNKPFHTWAAMVINFV
jgi:hypothetical protein